MIECTNTGKFFDEWIWVDDFTVQCPECGEVLDHETLEPRKEVDA